MNVHYINFLNKLNNNINKHNEYFMQKDNKFVKRVINLFIKYNVIRYIYKKENDWVIFLNVNKKIIFKNYFKKSHLFTLKLKHLNNINKKGINYILMNDMGLQDYSINKKNRKGGIIFMIIYN